jgi:protocatechuate 3,4-dioxygenase beta subunit
MRNIFAGRAEAVLTDMGGRFELRGLPSGQVTIVVEPVNYAKAELAGVTVEAGRETDELTVNVGKGGRIEGRVLADGRPQPNAMVTAMSGLADFSAQLSATTDDQGRYAIENVAPGSYRVASLPGFGGDDEEEGAAGGGGRRGFGGLDTVNTEVKDGETSVVNFGEKKIVVTGSLKRKSGETAKQMVIFIQGGAGRGARMGAQMATTDEAGHYEVTLKEPGEYDVYVGDQGMRGGTAVKATIPDKADVTYDIVVPEGAITGRVTDENGGKPLKGAMVVVSPSLGKDERPSLTSRRGGSRATTGEDGTYRVDGLGAGKYDVTFVMEGYGAETVPAVEVKGTDEMSSLDQPLRAGVPFKVRVSSPGGSGVSGAMVMVSQGGALMQGVTGMTREDGIAELKQLKPGIYSFLALTRDQAPGVLRDVAIGGERDSDTAVVTLSAGGSARIVVQDYGKKGISGATVELQSADGPDLDQMIQLFAMMNGGQGATGGDGALVLDHIPAGKYQAVVTSKDKKVTKSLTVEDGARAELTITLE